MNKFRQSLPRHPYRLWSRISTATIAFVAATSAGCARQPVGLYQPVWIDGEPDGIAYIDRNGTKLIIDVVKPKGLEDPAPAVLWIHGGGWALGSRNLMRPLAEFTASMGYVSATLQYRLATKTAHFPDPVQDVAEGIRFLRTHAEEYKIDPERIVVGGESAGGHLALMVGLCDDPKIIGPDPSKDISSRVNGIIAIYPPTDLVMLHEDGNMVAAILRRLMGCSLRECREKYVAASPVTYVKKDSCPILVVHGTLDDIVSYEQARRLQEVCRQRGAKCEVATVPLAGHGWTGLPRSGTYLSTLPVIANFLGRTLE